ncbi:MAG: hypothetical protein K0B87_07670 [Candidatus Syntrophosphaera sp.]|nr:hypothetical protein [Candidatus Syntrophosphaera sp.]
MKAMLKNIMLAYSGKCDGLVFYYNPRLDRVLVRSLPVWKVTASNLRLARIARNLKALNLSEGFRLDLITYTELYRHASGDTNCTSWYNLFNKLMWAMQRKLGVDLELLTREQITLQDLPCQSVKRAVDGGLLPPVPGYERLECAL